VTGSINWELLPSVNGPLHVCIIGQVVKVFVSATVHHIIL